MTALLKPIIREHCLPSKIISKGRFKRHDFFDCDKITTGLRHDLLRVNQTYMHTFLRLLCTSKNSRRILKIENDVFYDKFLLSKGRSEVFLRQNI